MQVTAMQITAVEATDALATEVQYNSRRQKQTRDLAIETLVKETHLDAAQVGPLYDAAHDELASHAKIKTYISVIATRLVRVRLQGQPELGLQ
jgi:hypothetical protein